jgi:hypothetical protein
MFWVHNSLYVLKTVIPVTGLDLLTFFFLTFAGYWQQCTRYQHISCLYFAISYGLFLEGDANMIDGCNNNALHIQIFDHISARVDSAGNNSSNRKPLSNPYYWCCSPCWCYVGLPINSSTPPCFSACRWCAAVYANTSYWPSPGTIMQRQERGPSSRIALWTCLHQ